jgi:hypothetical protein
MRPGKDAGHPLDWNPLINCALSCPLALSDFLLNIFIEVYHTAFPVWDAYHLFYNDPFPRFFLKVKTKQKPTLEPNENSVSILAGERHRGKISKNICFPKF